MAFFSKVKFWKKDEKDAAAEQAEAQKPSAQEEEYGPQSIGRPKQAAPAPGAMPPPAATPGSMPPPAASPMPAPAQKVEPTPPPSAEPTPVVPPEKTPEATPEPVPGKPSQDMPAPAPREEKIEAEAPASPPQPEVLPEPEPTSEDAPEAFVEPEPKDLPFETPVEPEPAPAPPAEAETAVAPPEPVVELEPEPEEMPEEAPMEPEPVPDPEPVQVQPEPRKEQVVEPPVQASFPVVDPTTTPEPRDESAPEPTAAEPAPDRPRMEPWQEELLLQLRESEPKLSVWLEHVLAGVEQADDTLWQRLSFFFTSLVVPAQEAEDFVVRFKDWLEDMEYEYIDEFRSELQYRLALALDLEDEEDERSRLFIKLNEGLSKTKEKITKQIDGLVAGHTALDDDFWEGLEEILIMADVGYDAAMMLVERLKDAVRRDGVTDPAEFKGVMQRELATIFETPKRITAVNPPEVVLMVGVNGAGKTTTVAKLAHRAQMQGRKVLVAAGDTFRAAAMEQLEVWAKRVGAGFFSKGENADPAAVAYEAVDTAVREGYDMIFMDTAGRLHTKVDLMDELRKIRSVLGKRHPGAPHRTILVLDATTGQNALQQTKLFSEAVDVDEIILTKLDGTAKGGVIAAIAIQYGKPISFIGLGEKMEDLRPFNGEDFAAALLG